MKIFLAVIFEANNINMWEDENKWVSLLRAENSLQAEKFIQAFTKFAYEINLKTKWICLKY